jgi:hypothetical protein
LARYAARSSGLMDVPVNHGSAAPTHHPRVSMDQI